MKQQINLYARQEVVKVPLSGLSCLIIIVVSAVLLAGVYGYTWQQEQNMTADMAVLKKEESRLQQQYDKVRQQMVPQKVSPALEAELKRIDANIASKKRFQTVLGELHSDTRLQFSAILRGLSEQNIDGLWLTRIQYDTSERSVILEGSAEAPDRVPLYLKGLGQEPAYAGAQFDQLQMQETEQGLSFLVNGELSLGGSE